ncbi:Ribonuclease H [Lasiodiplodia hormozganensis]|uniref:ribonuclease H n=1 Tax=Lasiodiplodia hormozganensis TaxID=869390 RepID=A0AA39Z3I4_9PEZI|nr:Ribonuclease H [Lasiodiplodia hormozganensis]
MAVDRRANTCTLKFKDDQGSQRLFTLSSGLQTVDAFTESLDSQPRDQQYLKAPYDPGCQCGRPHSLENSLMVSVDGACRRSGTPVAHAAIGVFFRSGSPYNQTAIYLGGEVKHTKQRAELYAGIKALEIVEDLLYGPEMADLEALDDLELVVIKTDSEYLVKGITERINIWNSNGWLNTRGLPLANADLFRRLDDLVEELKEDGITVKFLQVRRDLNAEVGEFANSAFNGIRWECR